MADEPTIGYRGYETHRCWKHLGAVVGGMDIVYKIDDLRSDFDFDRESEIRALARHLIGEIQAAGMDITEHSVAVKHDWPARGHNLVLGFTSSDPAVAWHLGPYRAVAHPNN